MREESFSGLDIALVNLFAERMPRELIGKSVLMSDGTEGVVRHVTEHNLEYPIVEVAGQVIKTDRNLYCVSMVIDEDVPDISDISAISDISDISAETDAAEE
jgi:hypothetical protein